MRFIINSFNLVEYGAMPYYVFIQFSILYGVAKFSIHNFFKVIKMAAHSLASWFFFLKFRILRMQPVV